MSLESRAKLSAMALLSIMIKLCAGDDVQK
jgi:hypothetical protein